MSEYVHRRLEEAAELHEQSSRGNKAVALAAAIIAVLAALGTLFSHHRSISAITSMNHAILYQTRASDKFSTFEAQRVRANLLKALVDADVPRTAAAKTLLADAAEKQQRSASTVLQAALDLEEKSQVADDRSESILKSYETLEIATTFFEVAIVLVSISALAGTRLFLTFGVGVSVAGLVMLIFGYFQGH